MANILNERRINLCKAIFTLSEKIKNYLIESRLYDDTADEAYQKVMSNLGIDLETPITQFNLYTNAVTFTGNRAELCKLLINEPKL